MKIKDIINESRYGGFQGVPKNFGKVRAADVDESIPNAVILPELRNTDTYMQMRYGMALAAAAAGETDYEQESVWAENVTMVSYTPQESELVQRANNLMGVKDIPLTRPGSQERTDVSKVSPVANTSWRKAKK